MVNWDAPDFPSIIGAEKWFEHQRGALRMQFILGPATNPSGMEEA